MSDVTHRAALTPGYRIQWYEIQRILGQGGFGITYLARDTNLDQLVAIKEYLPVELAVRDNDRTVHPMSGKHGEQYQWGLNRFIEEARTLARFKHPNIVRVLSVFEANNTAYMVMEYERGDSLQARLANRATLDETVLLQIVLPLLGGLEQVHAAGFIHRDIKPDNIFLREDGSPVLLDFGSARQATGQQTKTLTSLVSPGYAPFEQYYSKSDEQGPWTDIYGLAATMYRAICGRPPTDAVDRSRTILESNKDYLVSAREIGTGVYSERLLKAIDHGLAFRAAERPRDIATWKEDFDIEAHAQTLKRMEAIEEAPTVRAERAAPTSPQSAAAPATRAPSSRPGSSSPETSGTKSGSRTGLILGTVVALAGAAFLAVNHWPSRNLGDPALAPVSSEDVVAVETLAPEQPPVAVTPAPKSPETATLQVQRQDPQPPVAATLATENLIAEEAERQERAAAKAIIEAEATAAARAKAEVDIEQRRLAKLRADEEASARTRVQEQERQKARAAQRAADEERERLAAVKRDQQKERERLAAVKRDQQKERERLAALERDRRQVALVAQQAEALRQCEVRKSTVRPEPKRAPGNTLYFAALAVGENNSWGEASGYTDRQQAEAAALDNCREHGKNCKVQTWSNDCVAFARGGDAAAGWSWGASIAEAGRKAIGFCEQHSACCSITTAYCADEIQ